ncbi:MAG: AAA family ATPase [Coleofasciculus sp. G3-WIS-01]|uniref:AAA family ATPase n=1 Tax=Coleofasciculus sp. G3-WIS-01 TaxID=3069528 RepID=UPI0032FAADA2
MEGKRLIRTLRLKNLLSYGSEGEEVELQPLNVLIGANASGKSNLIEVLRLLRATTQSQNSQDLNSLIYAGGGIQEWLWKGINEIPTAEIETILDFNFPETSMSLRYRLCFTMLNERLMIRDEVIENKDSSDSNDFFYRYHEGSPVLNTKYGMNKNLNQIPRGQGGIDLNKSILSQIKSPDYPEITHLSNSFSLIYFYKLWKFSLYAPPRQPIPSEAPEDFLTEDGSNLALVVNNLRSRMSSNKFREKFISKLTNFSDIMNEVTTRISGGTVHLFIEECLNNLAEENVKIPANRLSDGTLNYLCLLALLVDPTPPPLICIEEPEIGLHPDILPTIAELLIEASGRTQLIVTTHSDALVSALPPESVLVCERNKKGSYLRRLNPEQLEKWLEKYTLGDLWRMGQIGGNRW